MLLDNAYLLELSEGRTLTRLCNKGIDGEALGTSQEPSVVRRVRRELRRLTESIERTDAMVRTGKFEDDDALRDRIEIRFLRRSLQGKDVDKISVMTKIMDKHRKVMEAGL